MSIILLEKDPFVELDQAFQERPYENEYNVRRPIYGMKIKETKYAHISLYQDLGQGNDAQVISVIDSSAPGGLSDATHNFILQGVTESRQERVQVMETFGDHFSFFYGQKPIVLGVNGMLFNTADFNWKNEFLANYETYLRGTKCVENRTRVFLGWDDVVAQGYILNVSINYSAEMPLVVPFSFQMLLTKPPLDLSKAAAPLESPNPGTVEPWTYRTFATPSVLEEGEGGVVDVTSTAFFPEYLTDIRVEDMVIIDPATGNAQAVSGTSGDGVGAVDAPNSAPWITGTDPSQKMWKGEDEALLSLNTLLAQSQTGADRTTAILAFRKDPSAFQLAERGDATKAAVASLGTGVANSSAVIDDAPDLE